MWYTLFLNFESDIQTKYFQFEKLRNVFETEIQFLNHWFDEYKLKKKLMNKNVVREPKYQQQI